MGNFVFNSPGRYKKMQAPPYSLVINMQLQEQKDGTWSVKNKSYPIITDNRKTNFNVSSLSNDKYIYFELSNLDNNQDIKYEVLDLLDIETNSVKPNKKIERFSESNAIAKELEDRNIKTKMIGDFLLADIA